MICADIKKVKTANSKDSSKQEDKSSPPPGGQCQTTHQSVHKGPITALRWNVLPQPPYSPDCAPSNFHLFGPLKDDLQGCCFLNDKDKLKHKMCEVKCSDASAMSNMRLAYSVSCKDGKSASIMKEILWTMSTF